jgi:hypothetical protein
MTAVQEIQEAVELLSPQQLARFRQWFEMFDADRFDAAIKRDIDAGKLDPLAGEAISQHRTRRSRDL